MFPTVLARNNAIFEFLSEFDPTDGDSRLWIFFTGEARERLSVGPLAESISFSIQYSTDLNTWTNVDPDLYEIFGDEVQIDLRTFPSRSFYLDGGG